MVVCDRCFKKFSSYGALSQHYETKHSNARKPAELERGFAEEKELAKYKVSVHSKGHARKKLAVFFLILIMAAGVTGYVALTPREKTTSHLAQGAVAPDFTLPSVTGEMVQLSSYRGKSNVLLFFNEGLSCSSCLRQMQDLDEVNQQFVDMNIVTVSITADPINALSEWAKSTGPQHGKTLSDQSLAVSRVYGVLGADTSMMPGTAPGHTFFLVDKSGIIKWRQDYGPYNMYVPNDQIITAIRRALGA
jgi:peroxiredoxin